MSFLAMKKNPFPEDGGPWNGAGNRAGKAAIDAAEAATEVLRDAIVGGAEEYDRWDDDLTSRIGLIRDERGLPRVGLHGDDDVQQRALEAEYGNDRDRPQPLMRVTQRRAKDDAMGVFSRVLREGIFG